MASLRIDLPTRSAMLCTAALCLLFAGPANRRAEALGDPTHVTFAAAPTAFPLAADGHATPLYTDQADWPGVTHAVQNFTGDVNSVSGVTPATLHSLDGAPAEIVLIGTIGRSAAIDRLIAEHKLDVSAIHGHWEMSVTQIVEAPFPGVRRALVIAGADKRGTIFGVYDLSEQIGVSPWAWWADVPVRHHATVSVLPGRYVQPEPRVKYRGIFLNDEAPALSGWTKEKFGGKNHLFYEHVFDLLLRLKANFLWPAMWDNAFNEDDPADPKLADEWGIVMGTSHHEPMMRAQQEWKRHGTGPWDYTTNKAVLDQFWREGVRRNKNYEELTTIGMRGDGDMAMSAGTNTALLEHIVADQRKILAEEVNPDVTKVPQVWALYKEVQDYYEAGMRVPDDVTLLWSDDNWGNLRRLPTAEERKRPGGAGIYYHFDYVGGPVSYKWLLTYNITKIWEQMHLAVDYGADRVWIVNVGDLKPMEFPIEFFLSYARTPERWGPNDLMTYTQAWATREFGPEHAVEIASLLDTYTRYNARRKPEMITPETWSLTEDHEADRIEHDWQALTARAEAVNAALPAEYQPAFFELVLYPLKASANLNEMYIAAGRNRLYARQGRASANFWADETRRHFTEDAALSDQYNHKLLNGKWDHMMDQTHIGYTYWNEPPLNAMPAVAEVSPLPGASMLVVAEGARGPQQVLPVFDSANQQTRTIEIANRGTQPFHYTATASAPWIHLSSTQGEVTAGVVASADAGAAAQNPDVQLAVSIDWTQAPAGDSKGNVTLTQDGFASGIRVTVQATRPAGTPRGFVDNDGTIAIDAEHAETRTAADGITWQPLPGFGETLSGVEALPALAASTAPGAPSACLTYTLTTLHPGPWSLDAILAPTLPFVPGRGLRYSVAVDAGKAQIADAWPHYTEAEWARVVGDGVHRIKTPLGALSVGVHTLHVCRIDAGVVLERLILTSAPAPARPAPGSFSSATYLGRRRAHVSSLRSTRPPIRIEVHEDHRRTPHHHITGPQLRHPQDRDR